MLGEMTACMRGLTLACELMAGNAFRHNRLNVRVRQAAAAIDVPARHNPYDIVNRPRIARAQFAGFGNQVFAAGQNPASERFVGDMNYFGDVPQYNSADYNHYMLDAYGQFKWSPLAQPLGTNWFLTMCGIKHKPELVPSICADIQSLAAREILAYFVFICYFTIISNNIF